MTDIGALSECADTTSGRLNEPLDYTMSAIDRTETLNETGA